MQQLVGLQGNHQDQAAVLQPTLYLKTAARLAHHLTNGRQRKINPLPAGHVTTAQAIVGKKPRKG